MASTYGACEKVKCHDGVVVIGEAHVPRLTTEDDFGCVYFEEKQKGPFTVRKGNDRHFNVMFDGNFGPSYATKGDAQAACDWLNDLWAKREKEADAPIGRHNCLNYRKGSTPDGFCNLRGMYVHKNDGCTNWGRG